MTQTRAGAFRDSYDSGPAVRMDMPLCGVSVTRGANATCWLRLSFALSPHCVPLLAI